MHLRAKDVSSGEYASRVSLVIREGRRLGVVCAALAFLWCAENTANSGDKTGLPGRYAHLPGVDGLAGHHESVEAPPVVPRVPNGAVQPAGRESEAGDSSERGRSAIDADLAAERAGTPGMAPAFLARAESAKSSSNRPAQGKRSKPASKPKRVWVRHEVIPGERLDEIATRYGISRKSVIRWNKLNAKNPRLRSGQTLKIYPKIHPPQREKIEYVVEFGDTWPKIAEAHRVDVNHLRRRWNRRVPRRFKQGTKLTIWIDPAPEEEQIKGEAGGVGRSKPMALPLKKVRSGAYSLGRPNRGRVRNAVQLPENPELYFRRKPDQSWGSTHTIRLLQKTIALWRRDGNYSGELVMGAISKRSGGRFRPHSSHQSGRDVDIRLPLAKGIKKGVRPTSITQIDWKAAWGLIKALADSDEVQYIFLDYGRQKALHRAAQRAGASRSELEAIIQYPRRPKTNNGLVRHASGHRSHFHVRFTCAENESACTSY